jgi:hypothetical protein
MEGATQMADDAKKLAKAIIDFNPLRDGDFDDDWAEDAVTVSEAYLALLTRVEELERAATNIGGLKVVSDSRVPDDEMHFRVDGKLVGKITGIK